MYMEDELQEFIFSKSANRGENKKWANWSEGRGLVFWEQNPVHKQGIQGKV
jgi:hypothetical protein